MSDDAGGSLCDGGGAAPLKNLALPHEYCYNTFRVMRRNSIPERMDEQVRLMEFKMGRPGLLTVGQKITVTEGLLPSNYYYTIDPSLAMSANVPFPERLKSKGGVVTDIVENARGFYVTVEFDE